MTFDDGLGIVAVIGLLAGIITGLWWRYMRRPESQLEQPENRTWVETDRGDRCLDCGEFIDWQDNGPEWWAGHCACCADDHAYGELCPRCGCSLMTDGRHIHNGLLECLPLVNPDDWRDPDETWVENLPPELEFPPVHEHREAVPDRLYIELSDDQDLLEWDTRQQKARISDIRTHLAMLGAREATWYADRMATVSERLAA